MIQLKISRVALLNRLWEVNPDRSMFSLIIELKDFCLYEGKSPIGWCQRCQHFHTEVAAGLMHFSSSQTGSLISAGRIFLGIGSCRHGSDCKLKKWDIFACEPCIRTTLYNSATVAFLFLYPLGILSSHAFGRTLGALVVRWSQGI